ncbi:chitinase [Aspergillus sp. HF37]|nr:chitinase [Aspergillus sp. HF37]
MAWGSASVSNPWTGLPRKYRINLASPSSNGHDLGSAGEMTGSNQGIQYIMGGLNTWGNPDVYLPSGNTNALCFMGTWHNPLLGIDEPRLTGCTVTFAAQSKLIQRGLDPDDSSNWIIEDVKLPDDHMDHLIPLTTADGTGYLDQMARDVEEMIEQAEWQTEQEQRKEYEKEPMITAAPYAGHVRHKRHHH